MWEALYSTMLRTRPKEEDAYIPQVFQTEANPVIDHRILSQYFTSSRVCYDVRRHLLEDMVRHGMTEEPTKVDLVQAHLLSNLSESGSFIDRE
jgi:hypothetical protein